MPMFVERDGVRIEIPVDKEAAGGTVLTAYVNAAFAQSAESPAVAEPVAAEAEGEEA